MVGWFPTTDEVERGQIEGQAEQAVAQRAGDELIKFVAHLLGHAAHDASDRLCGVQLPGGTAIVEGLRVEEGVEQPHVVA